MSATVVLATIKWDFVWQRHQALAVAAAGRGPVTFVESQPRSLIQLVSYVLRRRGAPGETLENPRRDDVRVVGASVLALLLPAVWAWLTARAVVRSRPGLPVDVVLYAPTPAYVRLARRLERTGGTVVYDAVVDWTAVPASWWPPRRARARELALPAHWRTVSDSAALATELGSVMHREVDVVLPAPDPAFAGFDFGPRQRSGTIGWFGVVRDETDVALLTHCARAGLAVETIGPVETPAQRAELEAAGVVVRPALSPEQLPAAMAHWDAVLCVYRGARAGTITPAKILNALTGFTVFTRGLQLPPQLAGSVVDLPVDDDAAVAVIRHGLAAPPALPAQRSQTWADRLDQMLGDPAELHDHRGESLGAVVARRGRANCANLVRLVMALTVIAYHGFMLGGRAEPARLGFLGEVGVDVFFVVSGFFIAMSWERSSSAGRFLWHRALRILPGFWTCLVVTAGLASLLAVTTGAAGQGFWTHEHNPLAYVADNALLQMQFFDISGGPAGVPHTGEWNLSLWTLAWEAKAYLALAAVGLLARAWTPAWRYLPLTGLGAALAVSGAELVTGAEASNGVRFVGVFCAGAALWAWRDRVPFDGRLAALCAVVVPLSWFLLEERYRVAGLLPMAYLTLWTVYRWRSPQLFDQDLSYGVYIYAFPVGQLLARAGLPALGWAPFVLATAALTLPVAAASWFLVEKPALAWKNASLATEGKS